MVGRPFHPFGVYIHFSLEDKGGRTCFLKWHKWPSNLYGFTTWFALFHRVKYGKLFYALLSTTLAPPFNPQTTPSISMANYSPPSSGNHRSLFVKPAKRGKQRAGGETLFALHYSTFNYQQHYSHNCFTTQLGTSCSFDSPGLARNEPTPGKHPQGDSTP